MLTNKTQTATKINDVGQGLVDSVNNMIRLSERLYASSKKYEEERFKNMPSYIDCEPSENPTDKDLTFTFSFEKFNGLYKFNIALPLFTSLQPVSLGNNPIDSKMTAAENRNPWFFPGEISILKAIYHPVSRVIIGIVSVANLLSLLAPIPTAALIPSALLNASMAIKIAGVLSSAFYVTPLLLYYFGKDYFMTQLDEFLSDIENDIENNKIKSAVAKFKNLPITFGLLSDSQFPGNRHLRRKYYGLKARIAEVSGSAYITDFYQAQLKLIDNPHDKLMPLRGIINGYERGLKDYKLCIMQDGLSNWIKRCEESEIRTSKRQAPYVAQIPTDSPQYHELGQKLRAQIQTCIDSLRKKQFAEAVEHFYQIKWDAYSKFAYPDAAVMYYQIESIIIFFSRKQIKESLNPDCKLESDECLAFALGKESVVQDIINKYYPEKAQKYSDMANEYEVNRKLIFSTKQPQKKNIFTDVSTAYSPLSFSNKEKHNSQENANGNSSGFPKIAIQKQKQKVT